MNVLIAYYSTFGNVYSMAREVAAGVAEIDGAEPVLRRVPELMPESVIAGDDNMQKGRDLQADVPEVTLDDFRAAGAYAFGTPTRFGNVSAQVKNQIDQLSSLWMEGAFEDKPAGVFVSTGRLHGGQEDHGPHADGPLAPSRHAAGRRTLFDAGAVHDPGRRLAVRAGACLRRRQ